MNNNYILSTERSIEGGFALVATLALLILLSVIAVALLSLSAISLRSGSRSQARIEAQANARMALILAVGELQKQLGPDQRISAPGAITAPSGVRHSHYTGVWDSWIAGSLSDAPISGDYPAGESHHQTLGEQPANSMRPEYGNKDRQFRAWLASLNPGEAADPNTPISLALEGTPMPGKEGTAVQLVREGSLGKDAPDTDFVSARLVDVKSAPPGSPVRGRYAWWVGDESQKARIMHDSYHGGALSSAEKIFRAQAPGSMANSTLPGLGGMTDETQLDALPSLKTLDLVTVNPARPPDAPGLSQLNFHHATPFSHGVLADVREGGLKRDLSTLLEREIKREENGDEFMLYRFGDGDEDRVPIQDLAAYYQLYQNDPNSSSGRRGGIEHSGSAGVLQVKAPDHGNSGNKDKYTREYTSLYRNPVPIRVQFVLGAGATEITQAERDAVNARLATSTPPRSLRETDKYKLLLGVKPVVSLWNPNNTPLVMGTDASQIMKVGFPPFTLLWKKYRAADSPAEFQSTRYTNLNYAISNESTHSDARARSLGPYIMEIQFARNTPIVFQPGEVKKFSIPINASNFLESGGNSMFGNTTIYQARDFLPDGFYVAAKTAPPDGIDVVHFPNSSGNFASNQGFYMVVGDNDRIDIQIDPEAQSPNSRRVSTANEITGAGFQFWMSDIDYHNNGQNEHFRNYQFVSRLGGNGGNTNPNVIFNTDLMLSGFPDRASIPYEGQVNALPVSEIREATQNGEAKGLLLFTMMAGAEVHSSNSPGAGAGRRITTRPFLHGSTLSAPQISNSTRSALYDYGWEWQVDRINDVEEAFQDDGASRGFYGGGYTVGEGVTHVVQQYLPALPPISIASLSSARLGGFSIARNTVVGSPDQNMASYIFPPGNTTYPLRGAPLLGDFRQVTATGHGGLAPHTLQAIGNSYAHPNIPADKAFKTYIHYLNSDFAESDQEAAYADHSYLANKALWDEFYFSSITPRPAGVPLYGGGAGKPATEVASEFLFDGETLSNSRLLPYTVNLSDEAFGELEAQYATYRDGFADKIASHMMVAGPFNINSTSVEAWKALFSSLKGKTLTYLDENASRLSDATPEATPVAPGMLANGEPINSSDLSSDPNDPPEQWTSSRSLSDEEIAELAEAMVEQVRERGPFLSLSEFINRRLDGSNEELALKGALQAALDDEDVSINAAFRTPERSLDSGETDGMATAFTKALEGPIAYGSTPYVDQADLLRHMGSILTPRGDTFVIRTYGDSLDKGGNVAARAWCEAVVQRTPEYLDTADEAHLKNSELVSEVNRQQGRRFQIIAFRWLNSDEI
jgi:type II secretory pathway pseudopilin PulG